MDNKAMIDRINRIREEAHNSIDVECDAAIQRVLNGKEEKGKHYHYLSTPSAIFKGNKPLKVEFENGEVVDTKTWLIAAEAILQNCNSDDNLHNAMMRMRNRVSGRSRLILSDKKDNLITPIRIDDDLFFEGKFDTEQLIKIMIEKIFKPIGYEYGKIKVYLK